MNRKELQALLRALETMKDDIEPDQDWMKSDRAALLSHVREVEPVVPEGMRGAVKRIFATLIPREVIQVVRGPVMSVLAVIVVVAGGSIAGVSASERSLPGDFLYPVKIAAEQTQLVFTTNKTDRLRLKTKFVERRVQEIKFVASSNDQEKPERVKEAAANLKRDLDTVKNQLEEVKGASAKEGVEAAMLLDKTSTEIAKELESVKAALTGDAKHSISEAETAAVNTSFRAVEILIQSEQDPETERIVIDGGLVDSISEKVKSLENELAQISLKMKEVEELEKSQAEETAAAGESEESVTSTKAVTETSSTKVAESNEESDGEEGAQTASADTAKAGSADPIATATKQLEEIKALLEKNELNTIPDKLLLVAKAAAEAERILAEKQEALGLTESEEPEEAASDSESSGEEATSTQEVTDTPGEDSTSTEENAETKTQSNSSNTSSTTTKET